MNRRMALVFLAAVTSLFAGDKDSDELNQFRTFIQEHPRALEEPKKDPSLLGKQQFAQEHKVVGDYLAKHAGVIEQVKGIPHFFDDLKATTKGGEHRPHPDGKGK